MDSLGVVVIKRVICFLRIYDKKLATMRKKNKAFLEELEHVSRILELIHFGE